MVAMGSRVSHCRDPLRYGHTSLVNAWLLPPGLQLPSRWSQQLGLLLLIKRNVRVLMANGDDLPDTGDPSRVMMRQIAGSFAEYEKTPLVTKLRGARERIREASGKCEGRKSYAERDPALVLAAKRLHRRSPKGHRRFTSAAHRI
jgi:hypothetical protein